MRKESLKVVWGISLRLGHIVSGSMQISAMIILCSPAGITHFTAISHHHTDIHRHTKSLLTLATSMDSATSVPVETRMSWGAPGHTPNSFTTYPPSATPAAVVPSRVGVAWGEMRDRIWRGERQEGSKGGSKGDKMGKEEEMKC
jgi:hypothetical protein